MAANTPNVTEPVSRAGAAANNGVTMNFGTSGGGSQASGAGQNPIGGGSNGSIGGSVSNGGLSFQQAPVNASTAVKNVWGGASGGNSATSNNPLTIQNDSTNASTSDYVPRTSTTVASASEGYHSDLPRSNKVAELPATGGGLGAVRTVSTELLGTVYPNAKGIEDSTLLGSVTNLADIRNTSTVLEASAYSDRIGEGGPSTRAGGNKIGSPTPQVREESTNGEVSNSSSFN